MFSGVVSDAVGFKNFFDRAIRSAHPVEKVDFFDGMRGSDSSIEKVGIEKALLRLRKNARFSLESEIALFDPPIRLRNNWPNDEKKWIRFNSLSWIELNFLSNLVGKYEFGSYRRQTMYCSWFS